jgi:hypothetical protein
MIMSLAFADNIDLYSNVYSLFLGCHGFVNFTSRF